MASSFAAINDTADFQESQREDESILQLRQEWSEDYQEIIAIASEDPAAAFRSCKSLLADMNAFAKQRVHQSGLTRSIQELKDTALKLALSLAAACDDHPFVIENSLKALEGKPDEWALWDMLAKSLLQSSYAPGALRLVLERLVQCAPKSSVAARIELCKLLESIGDYERLKDVCVKDRLFVAMENSPLMIPKYQIEPVELQKPTTLPLKLVHLRKGTWDEHLAKLGALLEDYSVSLNQPVKIIAEYRTMADTEESTLMNTLAMSFSRRPSLEDLAPSSTRTSKRRKDATSTPTTTAKKTREQIYEELDILAFLKEQFEVSEGCIERARERVKSLSDRSSHDTSALDTLLSRTDTMSLQQWIHAVLPLASACMPDAGAAMSLIEAVNWDLTHEHVLLLCYAYIASRELDKVTKLLARYGHELELRQEEYHQEFPCHYHFIKSFTEASREAKLFHLNAAQRLIDTVGEHSCFGITLSHRQIERRISAVTFEPKFEARRGDLDWLKRELFGGADLSSPEDCLANAPEDSRMEVLATTVDALAQANDRPAKWILEGLRMSNDVDILHLLARASVHAIEKGKPIDGRIFEALVFAVLVLERKVDVPRDPLYATIVGLLLALLENHPDRPTIAPFFLQYLAIDDILTWQDGTFLARFAPLLRGDHRMVFEAIRIRSGVPSCFQFDDPVSRIPPVKSFDVRRPAPSSFLVDSLPELFLESIVGLAQSEEIADQAKFCQVLTCVLRGLEHNCRVAKTNAGILERFFSAELVSCWDRSASVHLFQTGPLELSIGKALRLKVKILNSNKKRTVEQLREWRAELIRSMTSYFSAKSWKLLAELSLDLIRLELGSDMDYLEESQDVLMADVKIAVRACAQLKSSDLLLAELYLLLTTGPLSFLDCSSRGLDKSFVGSVRLTTLSDPTVFYALAHAARESTQNQARILLLLLSNTQSGASYEERYHAAISMLELWAMDSSAVPVATIKAHIERLGFAFEAHDDLTHQVIELAKALGDLDPKIAQHRHVFLICRLEPNLANWSQLFPFLTRAKGAAFIAVWQCEQDLAGMHLVYKSKYSRALLRWLASSEGGEEFFELTCRKICANLHDMVDSQGVLEEAMQGLQQLQHRLLDTFNGSAISALLLKHQSM